MKMGRRKRGSWRGRGGIRWLIIERIGIGMRGIIGKRSMIWGILLFWF